MGLFGIDAIAGGNHLTYLVVRFERGDVAFRILGKERFVDVAEIDFVRAGRDEDAQKFIAKSCGAMREYFSGPIAERDYRRRLASGITSPKKEWKKVKKHYELASDFDVKRK